MGAGGVGISVPVARIDVNETPGLLDSQRPKDSSIDYCEERRIKADAERQSRNRDTTEPGILAQHAQSETDIVDQGFQHRYASALSNALLHGLHAAELDPCRSPRFLGCHSAPNVVLNMELEIAFDLIGHLDFMRGPIEKAGKTFEESPQFSQGILTRDAARLADRLRRPA